MTGTTEATAVEGLLTTAQVAALLAVPESTVARWRGVGYGPPSLRLGKRVRYRAADVRGWLDGQRGGKTQ